jgi:hypothetical protein
VIALTSLSSEGGGEQEQKERKKKKKIERKARASTHEKGTGSSSSHKDGVSQSKGFPGFCSPFPVAPRERIGRGKWIRAAWEAPHRELHIPAGESRIARDIRRAPCPGSAHSVKRGRVDPLENQLLRFSVVLCCAF